MKKLFALLVVLALCGAANAVTISLVGEGTTTVATSGVEYLVEVANDGGLLGMDIKVTVTGDAIISGAMSLADSTTYGWDAQLSANPVYVAGGVGIGGAQFNINRYAVVGYIKIIYGSGEVVVGLADEALTGVGGCMDEFMGPVALSTGVVTFVPEPMTIALLGLGGLFIRRRK